MKKLLHFVEVEKKDGTKATFSIYKDGSQRDIVTDTHYEHLVHPSARSVDDEIRIVFEAKVIRTFLPGQDRRPGVIKST